MEPTEIQWLAIDIRPEYAAADRNTVEMEGVVMMSEEAVLDNERAEIVTGTISA